MADTAPWNVVFTREAAAWRKGLSARDRRRIDNAVRALEQRGPALGRPLADSIHGSRHRNMKELRSVGGHLRALFAFDRNRTAVVLVGGDKAGNWKGWYRDNIRRADSLFDRHRRDFGGEAGWQISRGPRTGPTGGPTRGPRPGDRSGGIAL